MRFAWSLFCLFAMVGLFAISSPAHAYGNVVPIDFPPIEFPLSPGGERIGTFTPGVPANAPKFSGGSIVTPGELRLPGRSVAPIPGRFGPRAGATRSLARSLFRNPYVAAGLALTWLAIEGIKRCEESGGAYFWCRNKTVEFKDLVFGRASMSYPLAAGSYWFTPEAAFANVYANSYPPPGWSKSYGSCVMVNGNKYRYECTLTYTPPATVSYPPTVQKLTIWGYDKPGANTTYNPITETEMEEAADKHPIAVPDVKPGQVIDPNADGILNASPLPVQLAGPGIKAGFVSAADIPKPYPCTAFASGSCLDGWRVTPSPSPGCPNCVLLEPVTVDATNTDAVKPPQAGTGTAPDTDTSTADPATKPDKDRDPCEVNPNRLGCMELGQDEGRQVPKASKSVSFAAEFVGLPAACPGDIPGPHGVMISYGLACDAAGRVRPIVIALGAMAALMIVIAAVRS